MSGAVLHAGLIARRWAGRWCGVLIRGPSGGGKSDLALRALDLGWRLVADDRVVAWASGGQVFGRAPVVLSGLCEMRGQGLVRLAPLPWARIALAVDLVEPGEPLERLPEPALETLAGVAVAHARLHAFEASALTRLGHLHAHALTRGDGGVSSASPAAGGRRARTVDVRGAARA